MIVAGFGFRSGATVASLQAALAATGARPDLLATADDKLGAVFTAFATAMNLPTCGIALTALDRSATLSHRVPARYGARSLAEAAALAAAGHNAHLITGRTISPDGMAVAAIAEGNGA